MRKRDGGEGPRIPKPYDPLEKHRLAESIVRELLDGEPEPLGEIVPFIGAGIYLIYYRGGFALYKALTDINSTGFFRPIYVG